MNDSWFHVAAYCALAGLNKNPVGNIGLHPMLIFIGLSGLLFIGKTLLNAMLIDIQYKCATQDNLTAGRYTNKNELYTIMHFAPAGASCL
jgi:hypothetical protein